MEENQLRARSFSRVAGEYERARPGYPDEVVPWLVGSEPCAVVDVGAGTGKLTRQLAALGHDVIAVEPSPAMLTQLRAAVPAARTVEASAEAIPLPDASVDAVVAAQAFHWFDPRRSLPEFARLLRQGGRLGLVWNMRDERIGWVARLSELIGAEPMTDDWSAAVIDGSRLFGPVEREKFSLVQRVDRESLRDLVASRSYTATREPEERAAILSRVGALYDEVATGSSIELPYVTYAFRARRA